MSRNDSSFIATRAGRSITRKPPFARVAFVTSGDGRHVGSSNQDIDVLGGPDRAVIDRHDPRGHGVSPDHGVRDSGGVQRPGHRAQESLHAIDRHNLTFKVRTTGGTHGSSIQETEPRRKER